MNSIVTALLVFIVALLLLNIFLPAQTAALVAVLIAVLVYFGAGRL